MQMRVIDLGRMAYGPAWEEQLRHHAAVLSARERDEPETGRILLVEHDPVITVTKKPSAQKHLVATPELLAARGIAVEPTNRGGDITYHGPGQLVAYPIVDLNRLGLRLHEYMRRLERSVIETIGGYGLDGARDPEATGVWVEQPAGPPAKIAAMGVRVQKWVTLHGLALNVSPDLEHFAMIVPCGLAGRPVTSMARELGAECPPMDRVKPDLARALQQNLIGP